MDWIGTTQVRPRPTAGYADYDAARSWACLQGWKTRAEFNAAAKGEMLPRFVARAPEMVYKNSGWQGWAHWLGNGKRRPGDRRPFAAARLWARTWALEHGVRTAEQWVAAHQGRRIPVDIPSRPDSEYRDFGWLSWGDWLATGRTRRNNQPWRPFLKARAFVHRLELASWDEWRAYARSPGRPEDIPAAPFREYLGHGWVSMEDWLGLPDTRQYGRSRIEQLLTAELAVLLGGGELNGSLALPKRRRDRVDYLHRELGLVIEYDGERWHRARKEHDRAKSRALRQAGWKLIRVREAPLPCLHRDNVSVGRCPSVRTAVTAVLHRLLEWRIGTRRLQRRWSHYLKQEGLLAPAPAAAKWRPFENARAYVRKAGLQNQREWQAWARTSMRPLDIPSTPERVYADGGWTGFGDWLGTMNVSAREAVFLPFAEAREVVHRWVRTQGAIGDKSLHWKEAVRRGEIPSGVPKAPLPYYQGKGWQGWVDWYGQPSNRNNGRHRGQTY